MRIINGVSVPILPMLEENKLEILRKYSNPKDRLLEFGSVGSTLTLARYCKEMVSIESDKKFLSKVKISCAVNNIFNVKLHYCNIGPTSWYGYPLRSLECIFIRKYSMYYENLWERNVLQWPVSLILIDGRFRVATFLTMVLENPTTDFIVIFDDFLGREEYSEILNYFTPLEYSGSAAIFRIQKPVEADFGELLQSSRHDSR